MEQSWERVVSATAQSPSGPVTVSGKRSYSVTCSGTALLLPDQYGGFAGPVESNCNYTAEGAVDVPWMRGTMSGRGVPETTDHEAGLGIDTDRGEYAFDIRLPAWIVTETTSGSHCQPPAVVTPTSQCVWVPFTEVNSERASLGSVGFRGCPLPTGVTTLTGTNTDPPEDDPSAKRSVTWTFSPAGVAPKDSVVVTIEGPACACLDGEKVPGAQVTWSARASRGGGSFGAFTVRTAALYNGADVSAELAWDFESIGAASTTTMTPTNPTGGVVDVTYTGLPELNAAFGKKQIEVSLEKGTCACKRTDSFRAFYSPSATNHPPPATA